MTTLSTANNATGLLASSITDVATTITVQTGHGARFPSISGASTHCYMTLVDTSGNVEIVKCTNHSPASDSFTCTRGQEGTTARSFTTGDLFEMRITSGMLTEIRTVMEKTSGSATGIDSISFATASSGLSLISSAASGTSRKIISATGAAPVFYMGTDPLISYGTSCNFYSGGPSTYTLNFALNPSGSTIYTPLGVSGTLTLLSNASNIATGANYISYGGTDAGLSFDSSNNATLSGTLKIGNGGSSFFLGIQDDSYYMRIHGSNAVNQGAGIILFGGSHATLPNIGRLVTGSNTVLEWGSAGNLTLGGTTATASPYASYRSIEGTAGQFYLSTASTEIGLLSNAYRNSAGNYIYRSTDPAAYFYQSAGVTAIGGADSGTAGNQITTFTALVQVEKGKSVSLQGASPQTGTGFTFPATQSASTNAHTLDDYEEGTFTPLLVGSTSGSVALGGKYRKVGDMVTCWITSAAVMAAGTLVGNLSITGLPFTSQGPYGDARDTMMIPIPWIRGSSDTTANIRFGAINNGATSIQLFSAATFGDTTYYPGASSNFPAANILQNGVTAVYICLSFSYLYQ